MPPEFTGQPRDAETGLDYFGARYMSSAQGRFTSPDAPFADQHADDPQSWNLYSYVRNNPVRHTDPTGRCLLTAGVNCFDYFVGAAKAVINIVPLTATLVNRTINRATGINAGDAPTLKPSNSAQAEGMQSASITMLFLPFAQASSTARATTAAAVAEAAETTATNGLTAEGLGIPKFLNPRQDLHLPPVTDGRSVLTSDPAELLNGLHDGAFTILRQPKSGQAVVDFGKPIGEYWNQGTRVGETQFGSLLYGKKGVHIVPANPRQW